MFTNTGPQSAADKPAQGSLCPTKSAASTTQEAGHKHTPHGALMKSKVCL